MVTGQFLRPPGYCWSDIVLSFERTVSKGRGRIHLLPGVVKARQKVEQQQGQANIENLLRNFKQPSSQQKIALRNRDGYEFIE